jgi:acyl carrier protein
MDKILEILKSIRPQEDFISSQDYINEGLLDSFDLITLVTELDKAFSISIDGVDIIPENFQNLEAIKKLLEKHGVGCES